jgi:hypothetical protein
VVGEPRDLARSRSNASGGATSARQAFLPSLGALIILAVGFRLPALFLLRYGGSVPDWSDFRYYHELAGLSAQGYFPDIQFWVEYPPLFPWLAVGAYQLSLLIPNWLHPYFWFDLILTVVLATADAGTIFLVDRLGDAFWGKPAGRRSAMMYAAMFLPAFAILGWFDTLPTFFLLLALYALVSSLCKPPRQVFVRSVVAGIAAGVGVMLKLFPVVALPATTLLVSRPEPIFDGSGTRFSETSDSIQPSAPEPGKSQKKPRQLPALRDPAVLGSSVAVVATLATIAIISIPFLLRSRDTFLATFRNVLARGSWMSPWAILDGYYETGGVASLHDRLFYNASATWGQPSHYVGLWWATVALSFALYVWRWWAARRAGTARAAIALTGFGVCLLQLLSRGFSQQFTVWLLPFVALILPGLDGAILAVLLTLNNVVLEGYLYVTLFPTLHQLLWISVTVRTVLLLWFAVECAVAIDPRTCERYARFRRRVVAPALGLIVVAAVAVLVLMAPSVEAAMLARTGDAPVVAAIDQTEPTTVIVFTQPDVFDRLAGNLRPHSLLLVAEPGLLTWTGDRSLYHRLETGLAGRSTVILVTDSSQPTSPLLPSVRTWLGARYGEAPEKKLGSLVLDEFSTALEPAEHLLGVQFGDAITLVGFRPAILRAKPGAPLTVTLEWRAAQKIDRDYTVSLQLLDPQGKLVAQHDAMPVNNTLPTTTWHPGESVADAIPLPLPATLTAGTYQLIVVMYDHQTLQRLPVHGAGQTGDHAVVGTVKVG